LTAIHVLLMVALLEVALNRIAVPMLRPALEEPPLWHLVLDYAGLFFFYFTNILAVLILVTRAVTALTTPTTPVRARIAAGFLGGAALVAALPILIDVPSGMILALEVTFALGLVAVVVGALEPGGDLGVRIGLPLVVAPLLFHTVIVGVAANDFTEETFNQLGPGRHLGQIAAGALAVVALVTPYCFAPRPFARAVTRPVPIVVAMTIAAAGAVVTKFWYPTIARATELALGVAMNEHGPDPRQALYLLALATLAWTVTACLLAHSPARRLIGVGIALVALGGYAFQWPHDFLLPLLGVALIDGAARAVRIEELAAAEAFVPATPPISDSTWLEYVTVVGRRLLPLLSPLHSLSSNGDGGLSSTIIVGDHHGLPVRVRLERLRGAVIALDIVVGREVDESRDATLTIRAAGSDANPSGPPATPELRTGDEAFDRRFRSRGSAAALAALCDEPQRAALAKLCDGWLAYWEGEGVRYRVYPGRGAPIDHPVPVSELALGTVPADAERLGALVELVATLGARVLSPR
jgi:hypothetical protein